MASTDPDELYTLRNLFWLGSFQQAINEGGRLNRLSDELKVERDEFVYRSYVGQGQYALVISEVDDDAPPNLRAVKLLAEYLENPSGTRDGVVETLGHATYKGEESALPTDLEQKLLGRYRVSVQARQQH